MACLSPLTAYKNLYPNKTGRYGIHFTYSRYSGKSIEVACGRCLGCRTDQSHEWAVRCYLEATMHERNSFLTLTYADEHLPQDGHVHKRDLQLFFKRMRHLCDFRYFACGEYGEKTRRPHYHMLCFGQDFMDARNTHMGDYYVNHAVSEQWKLGHVTIAPLEMAACAYVAGYVNKKMGTVDEGFRIMSRKPGIAGSWLRANLENVDRITTVVIEGAPHPVPKRFQLWALDELENVTKQKVKVTEEKIARQMRRFPDAIAYEREMQRRRDAIRIHLEQKLQNQIQKQEI